MSVSERGGGLGLGIGCAGLLPEKTHHLNAKVPAVSDKLSQ